MAVIVAVALNVLSNWLPTPAWLTRGRILTGIAVLVALTVAVTLVQQGSGADRPTPAAGATSATGAPTGTVSPSEAPTSASPTRSVRGRPPTGRSTTSPPAAGGEVDRPGPVTGTDSTGRLRVTLPGTFTIGGEIPVQARFTNSSGTTMARPTLTIELYGADCLAPDDVVVEAAPPAIFRATRGGQHGLDCVVTVSGDMGPGGAYGDLGAGQSVTHHLTLRLLGPAAASRVDIAVGVYNGGSGAWYTSQWTHRLVRG